MRIDPVGENKKRYLPLLLLGDEQETMIDRYLDRGDLYVLDDGGVKAACVAVREGAGVYELKNIAVLPGHRRQGYGRSLIDFLFGAYPDLTVLYAGTGASPSTLSFYRRCGFVFSHRVKDFFTRHYDRAIVEDGIRLTDMIYLKKVRPSASGREQ